MNEIIKRATSLYVRGFITKDELASIISKEYVKLWARGQILGLMSE
jgi:hypothetical protein